MTRIAHLSDLHLGLPGRRARLDRALTRAALSRASHLCLTGDLTESGLERDFADLSDALRPWMAHTVTIVPGNHDLQSGTPWTEVLASTPLRRFAATSSPGALALLGDCAVLAVSTQYPKRSLVFRALGKVDDASLEQAAYVSGRFPMTPILVCMHHPPTDEGLLGFFAGLTNRRDVRTLVDACPNLYVLSGHDHESRDDGRIFVAPALADSPNEAEALRLYDVRGSALVPI
jgi:3',5'-cyclic AMP phosphodiesterase CpdA